MARQIPTQAELDQVADDFDTFRLPLDASLRLNDRTVYGTTDPEVPLSMVNVGHLNSVRSFRGTWESDPADRGQPVHYTDGQVVIGSDQHLYQLIARGNGSVDPVGDDGTNWLLLSTATPTATELTSDPASLTQNLFAALNSTFTVTAAGDDTLLNASTRTETTSAFEGTVTSSIAAGTNIVSVRAGPQTSTDAGVTVTTEAGSMNGTTTYAPGLVDTDITFVDGRTAPTVLPEEEQRFSILDATDFPTWTVNLTPDGLVSTGDAYDVQWNAQGGAFRTTGGTFTPTNIAQGTTQIPFAYQFNTGTIQTGLPPVTNRAVRAYTPWFYRFSDTIPTDIVGATIAMRQGETQADDFSTSNMIVPISGTVGQVGILYFFIPTSITQTVTIGAGIARATGVRLPDENNVQVSNRFGGMTAYALHRFRLGLAVNPTNFTITSA